MPDWLQATFFDPESERYRLLAHDYQQHDIVKMRSIENCKLVDCVELPLKSYDDFNSFYVHKQWYPLEESTVELTYVVNIVIAKDGRITFLINQMTDITGWMEGKQF